MSQRVFPANKPKIAIYIYISIQFAILRNVCIGFFSQKILYPKVIHNLYGSCDMYRPVVVIRLWEAPPKFGVISFGIWRVWCFVRGAVFNSLQIIRIVAIVWTFKDPGLHQTMLAMTATVTQNRLWQESMFQWSRKRRVEFKGGSPFGHDLKPSWVTWTSKPSKPSRLLHCRCIL